MSDQEKTQDQERARQARNACHSLVPQAVPFIKSLVDDGLINGWRDVGESRLLTQAEKEKIARAEYLTADRENMLRIKKERDAYQAALANVREK